MFSWRTLVRSHLLLLSGLTIASDAVAQSAMPDASQPSVQQLQHEVDELREEIHALKSDRAASTTPVADVVRPARQAASGTPYFTENPGDPYKAYDASGTADWIPSQYITWRIEYNYRASSVPYSSGPGGVTPTGVNTGAPGSVVSGWAPDLRRSEQRTTTAILVNSNQLRVNTCPI
jgi:hypothetical protein